MEFYIEIYAKWNVNVVYVENNFIQLIVHIAIHTKVVTLFIVLMVDVSKCSIIKLNVNVNNVQQNILIRN